MLRTYAPIGQTPIIRHKLSREHLSVISGVTPSGNLYLMVQDRAYKGTDVVNFLEHLLREIPWRVTGYLGWRSHSPFQGDQEIPR